LTARVNEERPASFTYEVTPPENWSELLADRVRHHMKTFDLYVNFGSLAGVESSECRESLRKAYKTSGGMMGVRNELLDRAHSCGAQHLNNWRSAMYRGAAASDWYCEEGFNYD
jgi:hypothetical protein